MKLLAVLVAVVYVAAAADSNCGKPAIQPNTNGKIVGGTEAKPHSWPWMAALWTSSFFGDYQFCGGSLINENWVLTAGHCFYQNDQDPTKFTIYLGAHDDSIVESTQIRAKVKKIFVNPQYNPSTTTHDTTLLQLSEPVKFTDAISPVCMAPLNDVLKAGTLGWLAGWGSTHEGGDTTTLLNQVSVPVVDLDTCKQEYAGNNVDETMMCGGFAQGGKDTCQGDSGGPFMFNISGSWTQYGITSWGRGCAEAGYAGVYGSVAAMRQFIDDTIAANSK
jgi:secreted trypsin-like serine protease